MTRPPALPAGSVDVAISAAEEQAARQGVKNHGGRIRTGLNTLAALNVLSTLLSLGLLLWGQNAWPELVKDLGIPLTPEEMQDAQQALQTMRWLWMLLAALGLLVTGIHVWALLIARRAITAVRDWTLDPTPPGADEVRASLRTVRPWLTLGQWIPVIIGALYLAFFALVGLLTAGEMGGATEAAFSFGFMLLTVVVSFLPTAIINWLILGAIKRWTEAVSTRTAEPSFPVRPFARGVDGWLLFTLVLLVLGALNALASTAMFAFFPSMFTAIMMSSPETSGFSTEDLRAMQVMFGWLGRFAWLGLLGSGIYVLLAFLMGWSRAFANDVARVLDAGRPAHTQPKQQVAPALSSDW